jgi:hypothetical protein
MPQAGTAFIPIRPDFTGFHKSIAKQLQGIAPQFATAGAIAGTSFTEGFAATLRTSDPFRSLAPPDQTPAGARAGGEFATGFRDAVEAAIKTLPKARIDADSTPAERRIAEIRTELEAIRSKRIGVDLTDDEAVAKLIAFRTELDLIGKHSPSIRMQVDTSAAAGELAAFVGEEEAASAGAGFLSNALADSVSGTSALVAVATTLAPALVAAAAAGAGLAGTLAAAGAAGGLGVGALALVALPAISKIKAALTAQKAAQTEANTATGAGTQAAAAQASADGEVRSAELSLTQAQRQAKTAQTQLSAARVQARKDLADLRNSVIDGKLTEQSDALSVTEAREALVDQQQQTAQAIAAVATARQQLAAAQAAASAVTSNPASTPADRASAATGVDAARQQLASASAAAKEQQTAQQRAQLAIRQAIQALNEQRTAVQRLQQQQSAADKAGIAGDKGVVAARNAVVQADEQVQQQEMSLARARQSAAAAGVSASAGEATAAAKSASAMAKLTGPQKTLMRAWQRSTGAYDKWAAKLQRPVLGVLTGALKLAVKLLPSLTPFVKNSAKAFDGLEKSAGKALNGPFWKSFDKTMATLAPKSITGFGKALLNIGTGIAGILKAFAPSSGGALKSIDKLTGDFAAWGKNLGKSSGFQSFMTYVKANGPKILDMLGKWAVILIKLGIGLAPLAADLLDVAGPLSKWLAALSPTELLAIVAAVSGIVAAFTGSVTAIIVSVLAVAAIIARNWDKIWAAAAGAVRDVRKSVSSDLSGLRSDVSGVISGLEKDWDRDWAAIQSTVTGILGDIRSHGQQFLRGIKGDFQTGVNAISRIWGGLEGDLKTPVNWVIKNVYDHGIEALWNKAASIAHLPKLKDIPLLAQGAIVNRPTMAMIGEAGPEMVLPLSRPARMAELLGSVGIPMLGDGGIFGAVGGFLSSAVRKVGGFIEGNLGHAFGALGGKLTDRITDRIAGGAQAGTWGQIVAALPAAVVKGLGKVLSGQDAKASAPVAGGGSATANEKIARGLLSAYGWGISQFAPLLELWTRESGWRVNAQNPTSGAYGIPQALPASKMASAGADWRTDPVTQIRWGLGYIAGRYGSPAGAWAHEMSAGWYDQGGWLAPGYQTILNATRKPEAVLTGAQWALVSRAVIGGDGGGEQHDHYHIGELVGATVESKVRAAIAASQIAQRRRLRTGRRR